MAVARRQEECAALSEITAVEMDGTREGGNKDNWQYPTQGNRRCCSQSSDSIIHAEYANDNQGLLRLAD